MSGSTIKILVLAANPKGTSPLRLDEEVREIDSGLRRCRNNTQYLLQQQWAVRARDIRRALLDFEPQIVHFCGHGAGEEGLALEDELSNLHLVSTSALSGLFELFSDQVKCVLLNACYSQIQAEAIAAHIDYVIGMSREIGDKAAIEFAVGFYDALAAGKSIDISYKFGCNAIHMAGIAEHLTPVLVRGEELKLDKSRFNPSALDAIPAKVESPRDSRISIENKPYQQAVGDLLTWLDDRRTRYHVRHIQNTEELEMLWRIDKEAYQEASISLAEFYSWWEAYEFGLKVLFYEDIVMGAFGLWPLCEQSAKGFKEGKIKESDLIPLSLDICRDALSKYWYASGIVLRPELRKPSKSNPVIMLLTIGLNIWIESSYVSYPVEILATGYSPEGQKMLERFSFIKLRDICSVHDPYPLYALRARTKQDLTKVLKKRGI